MRDDAYIFEILQIFLLHITFFFLFSDNKRVTPSRYVGSSTSNLRNGNSKEDLSRSSSSASNRYLKLQFFSLIKFQQPSAVLIKAEILQLNHTQFAGEDFIKKKLDT